MASSRNRDDRKRRQSVVTVGTEKVKLMRMYLCGGCILLKRDCRNSLTKRWNLAASGDQANVKEVCRDGVQR